MVFFDESIEFSDRLLVQIGEKVLWEKFYRHGELWPNVVGRRVSIHSKKITVVDSFVNFEQNGQ